MELRTTTLPDGTIQVEWEAGYAQIKRLDRGILFFRKAGHFPNEAFAAVIGPFRQELRNAERLEMLCDCGDMKGYESGYRLQWTEWFKSAKGRVNAGIYTRSPLIRMAISVVNLVVPVFTTHQSLQSLYAEAERRMPSFTPSMLPQALGLPAKSRVA